MGRSSGGNHRRASERAWVVAALVMINAACQGPQPYAYPGEVIEEIGRVCQILSYQKRSQFLVVNERIAWRTSFGTVQATTYPTTLDDGFYRCGRLDSHRHSCAVGATELIGGNRCSFSR